MITRLDIENFKSLKATNIELKNLNVLMGLNGMGKSSFIQMLLLLLQSDKLEEGVIDLNGILAEIGLGSDALYQFAEEEYIYFGIQLSGQQDYQWKFSYAKDKDKLISASTHSKDQMKIFRDQTKKAQYISAERIGPRDIYEASSVVVADKKQLGLLCEYAAYFLNVFGSDEVPTPLLHPTAKTNKLNAQIDAWLKEISPGVSINTKYIPEVNKVILDYQFELTNNKTNSFRPKNVGFGISYVLPIILALLTAEEGKIIIIENPESHIHPRGQAELGKLISLAASNGAQLIIETHSDHILNGIRVAVKEKSLDKSKLNVIYFDKVTTEKEQYSKTTQIRVDENGALSEYPKNFLDEWGNQLFKLM